MAQQTTVTLTDDLDGTKAAETVRFGLDGRSYEIDLNKRNAAALRKVLAEFTAAGRKVRGSRAAGKPVAAPEPARVDAKAVREWAAANEITVSARGRIPADVLARYQESVG
jgi:hypothetical protein